LMAKIPASITTIANTQAKIGLSIKNRDIRILRWLYWDLV
jgi:hypothetical protein